MRKLPASWQPVVGDETKKPYYHKLAEFVDAKRREGPVYPPEKEVFSALELTPYEDTRVLILGQDPYHDEGQAHGLAFSVRPGVKPPPSLVNIFKELREDVGCPIPKEGTLIPWAEQGVLLLNAVLTVTAHSPNSHKGKGWETFTDAIISKVNELDRRVVFLLWGGYAQKKAALIDTGRHTIISTPHPSPLSARRGFFGSRPFSRINEVLEAEGEKPIDWCLKRIENAE